MKRVYETRGPQLKRTKHPPSPQHYDSLEGSDFLLISDKRPKIKVLLDSGSKIFLLNPNDASTLKVPSKRRENPLKITALMVKYSLWEENPIHIPFNRKSVLMAIQLSSPPRLRRYPNMIWSYLSGVGTMNIREKRLKNPWPMVFQTRQMYGTCTRWRHCQHVWMGRDGGFRSSGQNDRKDRIYMAGGSTIRRITKAVLAV